MYVTAVFDIICYKTCIKQCFSASMETIRNVCRPQIPKYKKSVTVVGTYNQSTGFTSTSSSFASFDEGAGL